MVQAIWTATDLNQDVSFAAGMIAGVPAGLYDTVDGIVKTASNPQETYEAGNSALAGAAGATTGEFIAQQMYPGVKRSDLTEQQRQTISALSTLAAGLAGGVAGNSTSGAVAIARLRL